jgi:hypothetical protein
MNGYDGSLLNGLLINPQFKTFFHGSNAGIWAGIVSSMYQIGGVVALPFVGPAIDTWGRRWGMFIGSVIILLGTVISGTTFKDASVGQFMGGRFILGRSFTRGVCVRNTNSYQDLVSPSPPLLDPSTLSKCLTLHTEVKSPPTATLSGSPEVSSQQVLSEVLSTSAETRLGSCPPGFNACVQESSVSSFGSFLSHLDGFTSTTSKIQPSQLLPNGMDKATLRVHG